LARIIKGKKKNKANTAKRPILEKVGTPGVEQQNTIASGSGMVEARGPKPTWIKNQPYCDQDSEQ